MEHAIKVFVSPANNDSELLESVSTQSINRNEDVSEKDDDIVEEELNELQNSSGQFAEADDEDEDRVFTKTEDIGKNNLPGAEIENGTATSPASALVHVARTLQLASSWLNRTRARSAARAAPRVDSFLEKLEMAGPSHVTRNSDMFDSSASIFVDPSQSFHYYWLIVVSICVLYNWIFIIARTAFADLQTRSVSLWLVLDYVSDLIYIVDIIIQFKTGK